MDLDILAGMMERDCDTILNEILHKDELEDGGLGDTSLILLWGQRFQFKCDASTSKLVIGRDTEQGGSCNLAEEPWTTVDIDILIITIYLYVNVRLCGVAKEFVDLLILVKGMGMGCSYSRGRGV